MSRPLRPGTLALLAGSALGAATLGGALRRFARAFTLMQDDMEVQVVSVGAQTGVELRFTNDFRVMESEVARAFPKQADGSKITYKLESHPVAFMRKSGLSKADLVGDGRPVTLTAHPALGEPHMGYLLYLKLAEGREIQFAKLPGTEQP